MTARTRCFRESTVYVSLQLKNLEAHIQLLEEAKERDHRKIGKDMELFMVDDLVGRGLPMFLPKGYTSLAGT